MAVQGSIHAVISGLSGEHEHENISDGTGRTWLIVQRPPASPYLLGVLQGVLTEASDRRLDMLWPDLGR